MASNGDVLVADAGNSRVDVFNSAGTFLFAFAADVGGAGVNTCTTSCAAGSSGSSPGQLTTPAFVAVDNSGGPSDGDVYVGDTGDSLVSKFDASGALVTGWGSAGQLDGSSAPGGPFGSIAGIAVDASGNLEVVSGSSTAFTFAQDASAPASFGLPRGTAQNGIAVDSAGDLFKVNGDGTVEEVAGSGSKDIGQVTNDSATGIAVDPATGDLFANTGTDVERYVFAGAGQVSQSAGPACTFASFSGCSPTGSFGLLIGGSGIAISATSSAYVVDGSANDVQIFTKTIRPDVTTGQATAVVSSSATLSGTTNPSGAPVTSCQFEYGPTTAYGTTVPCSQSPAQIGSGMSSVPVSAQVTGLQQKTTYHFRLDVSNATATTSGQDQTFATPGPPAITNATIFDVFAHEATVRANVNDFSGRLSDCHFEWGTTTAYGNTIPCAESSTAGPDPVPVSAQLDQLSPGTTYHYRLVATNVAATTTGPDASFTTTNPPPPPACTNDALRTGASAALPDCRVYEQVSPVDKNGLNVYSISFRTRVAPGGSSILYNTSAGFGDAHSVPVTTDYLADRSGAGWTSHNVYPVTPPANFNTYTEAIAEGYQTFTADLSTGVFGSPYSLTDDPNTKDVGNFYRRQDLQNPGSGSWELASPCPVCTSPLPPPTSSTGFQLLHQFVGASADLRHVVFQSARQLTAGAQPGGSVYDFRDGTLNLVSVLPDGTPTAAFIGYASFFSREAPHAVSTNGSRISFQGSDGNLYQRIDGATTIKVNASERTNDTGPGGTDPAGPQPARYRDASADGTRVFFDSTEQLTNDTFLDPSPDHLYLYDASASAGHHLTLISAQNDPTGFDDHGFKSVVGVSDDGRYVYFFNSGRLLPNQPSTAGGVNYLYVWHDGTLREIPGGDYSDNDGQPFAVDENLGRVTPDGRNILFASESISDDGRGPTGYRQGNHIEFYLYNADNNSLTCASCNPSGAPATSSADDQAFFPSNAGVMIPYHYSQAVSSHGRWVFFNTSERLVSQDTNGTTDAYEFDTQTGQIRLLSTGQDPDPSYFLDASPDGSDVAITTFQPLVSQDGDQNADVYDVRVNGGIAAQNPPPPAPPCTDPAGCQGQASAPGLPAVGSATLVGPGNPAPSHTAAQVGRLRVTSVSGRHGRLTLVVNVTGGGRARITGSGLRPFSHALGKAGNYRLTVGLTAGEQQRLHKRRKLTIHARVAFTPTGGQSTARVLSILVRA